MQWEPSALKMRQKKGEREKQKQGVLQPTQPLQAPASPRELGCVQGAKGGRAQNALWMEGTPHNEGENHHLPQ